MGKEKLVKSKERVRKYAEVYTPEWCVKKMCDMCDEESGGHAFDRIETTFLEPACGNGNFIAEIMRRKLLLCRTDEDTVTACGSVYGIDILPDNVQECRERIEKQVHEVFPGAVVMPTLAQNIVCGNFLKPETVWFLAEDAVPTNCRRLLTECKQLTESEVDDGKERGAGYEKPADEERHDERASRPGSGNPGADGVF